MIREKLARGIVKARAWLMIFVFACAAGGSFSNELPIEEIKGKEILITTKGGFNTVSYPHIEAVDC